MTARSMHWIVVCLVCSLLKKYRCSSISCSRKSSFGVGEGGWLAAGSVARRGASSVEGGGEAVAGSSIWTLQTSETDAMAEFF